MSLEWGLITVGFLLLAHWHMSSKSKIDLQYLFLDTDTNTFSIYKFGQIICLGASTWVLVRETNHDRLNEWLYAGYMLAWTGVNIANKLTATKDPNAVSKTTP